MSVIGFFRREILIAPVILLAAAMNSMPLHFIHHKFTFFGHYIFYGKILGSLICGLISSTWPTRKCCLLIGAIVSTLYAIVLLEAMQIIEYPGNLAYQIMNLLFGCSDAFINIIIICQIADNVTKNYRCSIATNYPLFVHGYILIFNLMEFKPTIFGFVLTIVPSILTWFIVSEPVTYFFKFDDENFKAKQMFKKSNKDSASKADLHSEVDEMIKTFQEEKTNDSNCYLNIFINGNWKPIVVMSLLTILLIVAGKFAISLMVDFDRFESGLARQLIPIVTLIIFKFISNLIGRKILFWIGGIGCIITSLFYVIFSIIMNYNSDYASIPITIKWIAYCFFIPYSLLFSLGFTYYCESFPLSKRNSSLAFVWIVQAIFHQALSFKTHLMQRDIKYLWAWFIGFLVLIAIVGRCLPETKRLTLRQSRNKFNNYWERHQPQPNANIQENIELC